MNATTPEKTGARIVVPVALEGRGYDIHIGRHQLCEAAALIAAGIGTGRRVPAST